jgi:hypothetical protein
VSGILLGGGPGQRFTGMAPGAELIAINRSGLPNGSFSIESGIIWAQSRGARIALHEFGSWVGEFLDGTSNYEIMINNLWEMGMHQFTASGNLAGPTRKKHAVLGISQSERKSLRFTIPELNKITAVQLSFLWRGIRSSIGPTLTLKTPDGSSRGLVYDGRLYHLDSISFQSGRDLSSSGTSRVDLVITPSVSDGTISGDFSIEFSYGFSTPSVLEIDAYIYDDKTGWMNGAQFTSTEYLTDDGTVTSPGTAIRGITVGAYSPRGYRSRSGERGDIVDFSGWGTTLDGRRAVDITAPGFNIFCPVSHDMTGLPPGGYCDFNGTSAALPFVAGCAALIQQIVPAITPAEMERILLSYASVDTHTGQIPNPTWGYGKLSIYDSIIREHLVAPAIVADAEPALFTLSEPYPNPFNTVTRIDVYGADTSSISEASVFNSIGQKVRRLVPVPDISASYLWDGRDDDGELVASGVYFFTVFTRHGTASSRLLFLK